MTRQFPLPTSLEEITCDWLTAALRARAPGATVQGFRIVETIWGTMTKIWLQLELDEAAKRAGIPARVILKGGFEPHHRAPGSNLHHSEVLGYRDVFPVMPLRTPECYFAGYDEERRQYVIIMEDLVARGVAFCHATRPQTHEQVARRLTALACFHAGSWASSDLTPGGRWAHLKEFLVGMQPHFERYIAPETWNKFVAEPRGAAVSVRFHDRDWVEDGMRRMIRFSQTLPHCVLHGDTHLGNLYIERDGTPGFFDSLTSRGPGMLEVSYHVSAALDVADRRRSEAALVQHYLDELLRNGVEAPRFDEAMRQYGIFLMYGYFIWITTETHYQAESVNVANAARVSAAMLDHDIFELLESIPA